MCQTNSEIKVKLSNQNSNFSGDELANETSKTLGEHNVKTKRNQTSVLADQNSYNRFVRRYWRIEKVLKFPGNLDFSEQISRRKALLGARQ